MLELRYVKYDLALLVASEEQTQRRNLVPFTFACNLVSTLTCRVQ